MKNQWSKCKMQFFNDDFIHLREKNCQNLPGFKWKGCGEFNHTEVFQQELIV